MKTAAPHIVIVEDDTEISRLTTMLLEVEGFQVTQVFRGDEAVEVIRDQQPDSVILDIMLPGLNGIQVCEAVRDFYRGPILMLTGSNDDISEIASFKNGADDFITKPFKPAILVARIQAIMRRCETSPAAVDYFASANLEIYFSRREVILSGEPLELTTSEYDLLVLLAQHAGEIVNRELCCDALRGLAYDGMDRSIDMKVSSLRKKLAEQEASQDLIKTVRGKGYMLAKVPQLS